LVHLLVEDSENSLPSVLTFDSTRWDAWQFDIHGSADKVANKAVTVSADLRLTGTGAAPALVGEASLQFAPPAQGRGAPAALPPQALTLRTATFNFVDGYPANPLISAEAAGAVAAEPYTLYLTGTWQNPMRLFVASPPLNEKIIRAALSGETAAKYFSGESRFNLLVPAEFRDGVDIVDWEEIETPPPAPPVPPAPSPEAPAPAPAAVGTPP
jgi:hypothetical protein